MSSSQQQLDPRIGKLVRNGQPVHYVNGPYLEGTVEALTQALADRDRKLAKRTAEWGHWGITLHDVDGKFYQVLFPVGPRGPIDHPTAPWLAVVKSWIETGAKPTDAERLEINPLPRSHCADCAALANGREEDCTCRA